MNAGQVTPASAPRDLEKLQLMGPYLLKRLMDDALPMVGQAFDEETRSAFLKRPLNERAQVVLDVLKQIDGGAKAAPAPTPAPAPAAAAPATDEKPARTPVTRNSKANGAANGAAASSGGSDTDAFAVLSGIAVVLKGVESSVDAMSKTVKSVESGAKKIGDLDAKLDVLIRLSHLNMAILSQLVENNPNIGQPLKDVLSSFGEEYSAKGGLEELVESFVNPQPAGK